MPTRHLHPRTSGLMVFGGGGGDPAPAPLATRVNAPVAPPPAKPVFTSSKPELANQKFDTEAAKNAAETEVDKDFYGALMLKTLPVLHHHKEL